MIQSFRDGESERVFRGEFSRRLPQDIQRIARRKLRMLDAAVDLRDLSSAPGNRLEALAGNLKGCHSIRVNDQWRVVFRWDAPNAYEVGIADYH